jgi:flavin reductase (DIM6/NTAB) family NADH-FMN oxidoreductase RutF
MMAVNIGQIQKLTSPNPFALVSTCKEDGTTNLMALSWWTYVSNRPATIAVCLSSKGFSGELIRANGEFGLSVVDESLKEAAFLCGTCSGRTENKPEKFGIALMEPLVIQTKLVAAHRVALECRLVNAVEASDHVMYIAEVAEAHSAPERRQLYAMGGYSALDTI